MEVKFDRTLDAQMSSIERGYLYNIIVDNKPDIVFEVGTWKGGGSTYLISSGLYNNGKGKLYTIEYNVDFYNNAMILYNTELLHLKPFINFNFGNSLEIYETLLIDENIEKIDVVFLDGADDAEMTMKEYTMFEKYLKNDSILAIHDFKTIKADIIKYILTEENGWNKLIELDTLTGFAVFKKNI